jgi:formylmethanofuran dehydrogenase subunit E
MKILCDRCKREYDEEDGTKDSDGSLICPTCLEDEEL